LFDAFGIVPLSMGWCCNPLIPSESIIESVLASIVVSCQPECPSQIVGADTNYGIKELIFSE
jgi:hypothetical protein